MYALIIISNYYYYSKNEERSNKAESQGSTEKQRIKWREDRLKKLRNKLIVPENDFRRVYMQTVCYLFNSNQLEKLKDYLYLHCDVDNLVHRQTVENKKSESMFIEIKGIDNYLKFCKG